MFKKSVLKEIIYDQKEAFNWKNTNLNRLSSVPTETTGAISIISGIRRCGKSTLLQEIRSKQGEQDFFLNFDDERLYDFQLSDFQILHEVFLELFGEQHTFYFDEIQNIAGWERFVRRLHDYNNYIYITGSNASMLSKELGTHLTGRYIAKELYPFSFSEFLQFHSIEANDELFYSTNGKATIAQHFDKYMQQGGFPEYVKQSNPLYLKTLYENILYRDIMVRNKITNEKALKELMHFIVSNITKPFTYNSLTKVTGINSPHTTKQYLSFLEDSYIIFQLSKFDYSVKKQIRSPKKCYFIDNAMAKNISFRFSEDADRLLENLIFRELKTRGHEIFYHNNKHECDFLIRQNDEIIQAIQVSYDLSDSQTAKREIEGLFEAMNLHKLNRGYIITLDEEDEIAYKNKQIMVVPAWKWMLQAT